MNGRIHEDTLHVSFLFSKKVAVVEREVGLQVPRATAAVAATGQQEQVVLVTAQVPSRSSTSAIRSLYIFRCCISNLSNAV